LFFFQLLMIKTFRQDRLVAAAKKFSLTVLGSAFDGVAEKELDLVRSSWLTSGILITTFKLSELVLTKKKTVFYKKLFSVLKRPLSQYRAKLHNFGLKKRSWQNERSFTKGQNLFLSDIDRILDLLNNHDRANVHLLNTKYMLFSFTCTK